MKGGVKPLKGPENKSGKASGVWGRVRGGSLQLLHEFTTDVKIPHSL